MRKRLTYGAVLVAAMAAVLAAGAPGYAAGGGGAVQESTVLIAVLEGAAEVPGPGDVDGTGAFIAKAKGDRLCYQLDVRRIKRATAAHIHPGAAGTAGGIAVGLISPNKGAFSAECIETVPDSDDSADTLSESELAAILAGPEEFYVNVHNEQFPAGAIRGQLF